MKKNFFEFKDYNTPVYETSNFVVIPTLGALIEGWLLIVPKVFYLNFSQLPSALFEEVTHILNYLEKRFLPLFETPEVVVFEHGPSETQSTAGCGVDYAHLHWVPIGYDLKKGMTEFLDLNFDWMIVNELADVKSTCVNNEDYLYLRDQTGKSFISCQNKIPSQVFRKVIAHYLKQPEFFDWKTNFGSENIRTLYSKLNIVRS